MAEERASLYRTVFITAAATAGVVVLAMMMIFLFSSRQTGELTLAKEDAVSASAGPARIPTRMEYRDGLAFFNPINGEPAIWYFKKPDGSYDLFDAPLQAVTPVIVGDIQASFRKEAAPARVASAPRRAPAPRPSVPRVAAEPQPLDQPVARSVTIPAGTRLEVVLDRQLSTETNSVGDSFPVTLTRAVVIDGQTVLAEGAKLTGEITALERPGRVSGVARMTLALKSVGDAQIQTAPLVFEGEATKAEDAAKVGIGAAIGTGIGALFGGKKGAGTGAVVGAGGGAGTVLATRGENLVLAPEQEMAFALSQNATVER